MKNGRVGAAPTCNRDRQKKPCVSARYSFSNYGVLAATAVAELCQQRASQFLDLESARGLAQSKTLRVLPVSPKSAPASWSAVALRRFAGTIIELPSGQQTIELETRSKQSKIEKPMTCIGKVVAGKVALPNGIDLPDGTEVEIHIDESVPATESFATRFKEFIGMADDLPGDLAQNLDHYLHGLPKR